MEIHREYFTVLYCVLFLEVNAYTKVLMGTEREKRSRFLNGMREAQGSCWVPRPPRARWSGAAGAAGRGRSGRRGASAALGNALVSFAGLVVAALAAVFVVGVLLAMYDFNYGLAPNECIEFPENPLYTELTMRSAAAPGSPEDGARSNVPGRVRPGDRVGRSFFEGEVGTAGRYNAYADDPPYRLVHVFPQGAVSLHRALTEGEIWGARAVARGRGDDRSVRADRSDIPLPVLFVPGHGGSYNQSKASAAQAVVEHLSASSQSVA